MKIENMRSSKGRPVPNQFIATQDDGSQWFQSYATVIAVRKPGGKVLLDRSSWDISATTRKYRNRFLGETSGETRAKVASGVYELADLNSGREP